MPRWITILALSTALLSMPYAEAQAVAAKPPAKPGPVTIEVPVPASVKAKALLPDVFDGWETAAPTRIVTDPAQVDGSSAAALKEYDFAAAAIANYKRDNETLSIRALRFNDASGAYGAYSFYRQNGWPKEEIGTGATSDHSHNRVLFWKGSTVVDATFSRIGPMSAAELRDLANQLPAARETGPFCRPFLPTCPRPHLTSRRRTMRWGPRATSEGAECCRRS